MANVNLYAAIDMEKTEIWYGAVTSYNRSTIVLQAGAITATYSGNFTYDSWGYVYGQVNSYQVTYNRVLQASVTGIGRDAYTYNAYLMDGDAQGALRYVLSGQDIMNGSAGADRLYGYSGMDRLNGGGGSDWLNGGSEGDAIFGELGDDVLYGDDGRDRLTGGAGSDDLYGGSGADVFILRAVTESRGAAGRDAIFDFRHGTDKMDLSEIDANAKMAGNQAFRFIGNAGFDGVAGQLRYVNGQLRGDIDGNRVADFAIDIINRAILSETDFIL